MFASDLRLEFAIRHFFRAGGTPKSKTTPLGAFLESLFWVALTPPPAESKSKLGIEMVDPEPCKELRRRNSAAISGWEHPLLTFIYPSFDCFSAGVD